MKKIILLKDNGGRLANQLWNYASIFAYCLEKKYRCSNYAFFRYQHYFDIPPSNFFIKLFLLFHRTHKNYKLSKILNIILYKCISIMSKKNIIRDFNLEFNLSPSINGNIKQRQLLTMIDQQNTDFYFVGWLFRNSIGLKKYHKEIVRYFKPKDIYNSQVLKFAQSLRQKYKLVIGVHIRQGDYKTWQGGKFFFSCADVAPILHDFLKHQNQYSPDEIVFVICSDGMVEESFFSDFNIVCGPGTEVTDLYMLAQTDMIIGSNSTYGTWAAYYGQIPFFEFSHSFINWQEKNIPI